MNTLLLLNVLLLLFIVLMFATLGNHMRRSKRFQDEIIRSLKNAGTGTWFRIYLSRPAHFAKRLKFIGFEARGVLVNADGHIRIIAQLQSGEKIDSIVEKDKLALRWLGNAGLGSSNLHWFAIGTGTDELIVSADTGMIAVQSRQATADICRIIAPRFDLPEGAASEFALEKNPASLAMLISFFVLIGFGIIDGAFVDRYQLIKPASVLRFLPAFMLLMVPCYWILTRYRVPSRESLVLSLLVFVGIAVAYIPTLQRVEQLLAQEGQTYAYTLKSGATLESVIPGPPPLKFSAYMEYWSQFKPGSTHQFKLVHGPLRLWQLDRSTLDQEFKHYYDKHPSKTE
jgi:hypothetical protein